MLENEISFDVQHLIDEVAARHRLVLKPDDAAFAIVTMNRLVLEETLETIHRRILEELAAFQTAGQKLHTRIGVTLATELRQAGEGIRHQIRQEVRSACLQAWEAVQPPDCQPAHKYRIHSRIAVLCLAVGIWAGRVSTQWWPYSHPEQRITSTSLSKAQTP